MSIATLADIIIKVRKLTGSATTNQLTDAQIIDYINSFYLYDFPAQFRSLKLKDKYTFNTQRGIDTYPFDSEHYTTIEMPCYVAKREVNLFQDPWSFYGVWYNWQYQETLATGNGSNGGENGAITAVSLVNPIQITSAAHGLATGDEIAITGIVGTTALNNLYYTITFVDANNFTLDGIDGTNPIYQAYSAPSGYWTFGAYSGTCTAHPLIRSTRNKPMVQTNTVPTTNFLTDPTSTSFPQANIGRVQNLLITANLSYGSTLNVTDDGAGNLIGDCLEGGVIDYETGEVIGLIFTQAIPSGNDITIEYNPANPPNLAIPQAIMFFQNQFTLRPVPDKGYTVELVAYRQPSQALLGTTDPNNPTLTGTPELLEWHETLAFGAAKKIYEDRLDPDGVALMDKSLTERYSLNETRTCAQLGKQSMNSIFRDQLSQNYGSGGWGFGSGG